MIKLNISEWLKIDAALTADFEVKPLSEDTIELVESASTHAEMLSTAADAAIKANRDRLSGDVNALRKINVLLDFIESDTESDMLAQIGERVCNVSGLAPALAEQLKAEQAIINGDDVKDGELTDSGVITNNLAADEAAENNLITAA